MRLIDADKLLETLQDLEPHCDNKEYENGMLKMMRYYMPQIINDEPTAYDIDNVVEELEENASRYTKKYTTPYGNNGYRDTKAISIHKAIEIVKQEAEQYNNGWIACSERLPEESGYYLVTYHNWSDGNFLPKYDDTYVRRLHYQISEHFVGWNYPKNVDDRAENDCHKEVIAWQPLPEPFKECD